MRSLKDTFALNLSRLMAASNGNLDSAAKVAAKAKWPRGGKAGKRISPRQVQYAIKAGKIGPSPTLDFVEAMAAIFRVEPWELITEPGESRRRIIEKIITGSTVTDEH